MLELKLPFFFAAGAIPQFMTEVVALIVAGAVIAYVCFRFRLVPIVGFLLAGVLIGPNALGFVRDQRLVDATAEIGVILLLFTIGIEFSLEKLAKIQKLIFGGGSLQVGLSILATTLVLLAFGVDWRVGVFTGMLVALSSTAIVLKILSERNETNSEAGQIGLGLLIFQDLAIVLMVLLVPTLAGGGGSSLEIVWALTKAGLIVALVLLIARRIMPKILEMVAKTCSPELFLLSVIAICFGTAYLTSLAGVSLSLGAFLAGLMVSESRFSQHALSETLPLQILFSATFFVSVGMLLDLNFLVRNLPLILGIIAAVLLIKVLTTAVSVRALGYKMPVAAASALMLAQIGEFSFVLERAGREVGLTPAGMDAAGSQTFIAATVVLMILTPLLMRVGNSLSDKMETRGERKNLPAESETQIPAHAVNLEDHVIVAGYGQAARCLVRVLNGSGIPYIITTLSPEGANEAEAENLPVVRGDATRQFLLQLVGIEKAKMMVIADDNPATAHRITMVARQQNPTMRIVVRTRYTAEVEHLAEAGADTVIAEELESIVQLFGEVLRDYRIAPDEIEEYEALARQNGYSALFKNDPETNKAIFACETGEDCKDSRTVKVRDGMPVAEKSLANLQLAEKYKLHLKAVRRGAESIENPTPDFVLRAGDELVLSGATNAFAQSAALFRSGNSAAGLPTAETAANRAAFLAASGANGNSAIDTEKAIDYRPQVDAEICAHLDEIKKVFPSAAGCEECLRTGDRWVHLRICLICGHVGCCDDSKNKHATAHFHQTAHPIIKSMEPGEDWAWCYADETYL
jgi:monovalent cation:H+ antiporter-2, CPA2 family